MKFDYAIGNPPFQDGDSEASRKPPVYNYFMDAAYQVAEKVELITPGRFLFEAGQTPKEWNRKMLNDEHLKVLYYESDSSKVFPSVQLKGGVSITYRDDKKNFEPIGVFSIYTEMNSILKKVSAVEKKSPRLNSIIASQGLFKFSKQFFAENPNAAQVMGNGTGSKIVSSVMEKLPNVFSDEPYTTQSEVKILGRVKGKRTYKHVLSKYIDENKYTKKYKLFIPEANNNGTFGETLTAPTIGLPNEVTTDTFLCAGPFETELEPHNMSRYFKTKLFRALLGVRKVTQHCPPIVWSSIPLLNFSSDSDINWLTSIHDIDQQLYKKYGLSQQEIDFIESHVKELA